jgi:hypothetical protein
MALVAALRRMQREFAEADVAPMPLQRHRQVSSRQPQKRIERVFFRVWVMPALDDALASLCSLSNRIAVRSKKQVSEI